MNGRDPDRPSDDVPTPLLLLLLCAGALLLVFPLLQIGTASSLNYNEGWNAYRDRMAAYGLPLYARPPGLSITNYPFLSFHLVGGFGRLIGGVVLAGRLVALAGLLATVLLTAVLAESLACSRRAGLLAGLSLLLWIETLTPERRAMDDPGLLAAAFASGGLMLFWRERRDRPALLVPSAILFALALFTKEDVVALPATSALFLLARRQWRDLAILAAAGTAASCVLLTLTVALDGRFFLDHLLRPRLYRPANLAANVDAFLLRAGVPLVASLAALAGMRGTDERRFVILLLATTLATSTALAGGDGVAPNIFYPALIALALALAPGRAGDSRLAAVARPAAIAATLVFAAIGLGKDVADARRWPARDRAARETIAVLRAAPGPAICEDILLCFRAGKALGPDPFFVSDQARLGRLNEAGLLRALRDGSFGAVEMDGAVDPPPGNSRSPRRFGPAFLQALLSRYGIVSDMGGRTVFEPRRPEAWPH